MHNYYSHFTGNYWSQDTDYFKRVFLLYCWGLLGRKHKSIVFLIFKLYVDLLLSVNMCLQRFSLITFTSKYHNIYIKEIVISLMINQNKIGRLSYLIKIKSHCWCRFCFLNHRCHVIWIIIDPRASLVLFFHRTTHVTI